MEICTHCGQELQKASQERKEIGDIQKTNIAAVKEALTERQDKLDANLTERQNKLDAASEEALNIIKRIEAKVGADAQTMADIRELEAKVRAKAKVLQDREDLAEEQKTENKEIV